MSIKTKDKLSVAEIRASLIENGYSASELQGIGKAKLRGMLEQAESSEAFLDKVSPEVTDTSINSVSEVEANLEADKPDMRSPDWTKYVMSLFDKSELENSMPRVDALRRIAYQILGAFNSQTEVLQVPSPDNAGRATVKVQLTFLTTEPRITIDGAADVFSGNTAKDFATHAVATAETRAEGRALRKALMLTRILSAEELQNADADEPNGSDSRIVTSMITNLQIMADRLGLDPLKVAISLGNDIQVLEDLTQKQGLDIAKELGKYQRKEKEITDAVRK